MSYNDYYYIYIYIYIYIVYNLIDVVFIESFFYDPFLFLNEILDIYMDLVGRAYNDSKGFKMFNMANVLGERL